MIHYGIVTGKKEKAIKGFTEYFACESTGHVPGKCDRSVFEGHLYPYMTVITYILIGTIPMAILNFIVNCKRLQKSVKGSYNKIRSSILKLLHHCQANFHLIS